MNVNERIEALRSLMEEKGIDIYVVPTADFHQSEYVGEYFKARKYITGFTGSAGTAVITREEAKLWTDGRYFIQAAARQGTSVELMKMGEPGVLTLEEYVEQAMKEGGCIGFDGRVVTVEEGRGYQKTAEEKAEEFSMEKISLIRYGRIVRNCPKSLYLPWILSIPERQRKVSLNVSERL